MGTLPDTGLEMKKPLTQEGTPYWSALRGAQYG
jgi:hypothetical protein